MRRYLQQIRAYSLRVKKNYRQKGLLFERKWNWEEKCGLKYACKTLTLYIFQ